MSKMPPFLIPGFEYDIGSYLFTPDEIKKFAKKFDPQPFHLSNEAAKSSLFGALCASGWHTAAIWMKLQRNYYHEVIDRFENTEYADAKYGPSPGFKDLKWLKPVFAGDTISFSNKNTGLRKSASKPGWWIKTIEHSGSNQNGEPVITFQSSVLIWLSADVVYPL